MNRNPTPSPITRAYLDAQKPIVGLPTTPRETALFEALQASLQKLYDSAALHADCIERVRDVQDELEKGAALRLKNGPEPEVNLVTAERIIDERRRAEPLTPSNFGSSYEQLRHDREATDLIEQLVDEVEAWRALAKEST